MRSKAGSLFMILGAALIVAALSLFLLNRREADQAGDASAELMPKLMEVITEREAVPTQPPTYQQPVGTPVEYLEPSAFEMTQVEIDGYAYIGYLAIPAIDLELPVMADWDYTRLQTAPCRYTGSVRGENLVILAHNYWIHFGRLSELQAGDSVSFTDMDGIQTVYEVVAQDVLAATAVEEMTSGEFDLTLFTCTYGGQSRVTVYCDMVS